MTSHVGPGSLSYGCKRHYHIRETKGANGPGPGKVAPVGVPCVRPQSDMMCYMLDRCGLGSGSRHPYAKYMKDIVTNKRKIPKAEISTMLANYTFKGGIPKKLGDPG